VVSSGDRFSRFGFSLFVWIFEQFGAKLVSIAQETRSDRSQSEELADDLMEIITVFTARYHGSRRYGMCEEIEDISEPEVATDF
jgi:predicted site-specific integrase-resolvase